MADWPRVEPFGDAAVLVTFGETIDPQLNRRVHALARQLDATAEGKRRFGSGRCVPAYASLLIPFDPCAVSAHDAAHHLREVIGALELDSSEPAPSHRTVEIPVRYGGDHGPDLLDVAERTGLTPDAVIEAHASIDYTCFFLGFAPGFAYLGVLRPELELPRRGEPRTR
ncbi:MAG: allophanate hydrolase subunit 1, partial [Chloroflexota bacterium]|nr:allophanate hydrolase subunit 1 [Chloroflexota bacterium]